MTWEDYRIKEPPQFSITCNCGMTITGQSEPGLIGLFKHHTSKGKFHKAWINYYEITENIDYNKIIGLVK